jgi:hypothetical protein
MKAMRQTSHGRRLELLVGAEKLEFKHIVAIVLSGSDNNNSTECAKPSKWTGRSQQERKFRLEAVR